MAVEDIHIAARTRDVDTLRRLLAEGVSPDTRDDEDGGQTPLHWLNGSSLLQGDPAPCFELLRDAGANLEATEKYGSRPLHCAASHGDAKLVSLLVEAGANVNAADGYGATALHSAATEGGGGHEKARTDCVKVLLAAGADVDARNNDGRTPLRVAMFGWQRRMLPLFLRAGAEIDSGSVHPYVERVRNAGGFKKYEQAHLARITLILAPTPLLPPELVRKVLEFWLHAGYY